MTEPPFRRVGGSFHHAPSPARALRSSSKTNVARLLSAPSKQPQLLSQHHKQEPTFNVDHFIASMRQHYEGVVKFQMTGIKYPIKQHDVVQLCRLATLQLQA